MALVLVALLLAVSAVAALIGGARTLLAGGSQLSAVGNLAGAALYLYWARLCLRNRDRGGRFASRQERALTKRFRAGERLTAEEITDVFFPPGGVDRPDLPLGTIVIRDPEVVRRCMAFIEKHRRKGRVIEIPQGQAE